MIVSPFKRYSVTGHVISVMVAWWDRATTTGTLWAMSVMRVMSSTLTRPGFSVWRMGNGQMLEHNAGVSTIPN